MSPWPDRAAVLDDAVRTLNPGYFALVMATGIVSMAMRPHHAGAVSAVLLWIAVIAYVALVVLNLWRLIGHRVAFTADLRDPKRALGLFTFVAATDVIGAAVVADAHRGWGLAMLAVGGVAWLALGYLVPWTALVGRTAHPTLKDIDGTWFIWVVASQSVAVLAASLEPVTASGRRELALLALVTWSVGVVLYAATGMFVAARLLAHPLTPADMAPPYWVAMGATAITVVAGARIVEMSQAPAVAATGGLVAGVSVVFWAFGSWLIPPLVAAGIWRHVVHRVPLGYDVALWSIVFPLGMYGVAGHYLGQADRLPLVEAIGASESWLALVAWTLTFAAMLRHLARRCW